MKLKKYSHYEFRESTIILFLNYACPYRARFRKGLFSTTSSHSNELVNIFIGIFIKIVVSAIPTTDYHMTGTIRSGTAGTVHPNAVGTIHSNTAIANFR